MRRGKASNLAKIIYRLKEKEKATFYTPSAEWVLRAASTKGPEEREFVEDSGASMHMVSRKDLNSAELETRRTSQSPTTVETANGNVLTKDEATVYVRENTLIFFNYFPQDRNCDICLKTKITRASCRRRVGTVVPKAENGRGSQSSQCRM